MLDTPAGLSPAKRVNRPSTGVGRPMDVRNLESFGRAALALHSSRSRSASSGLSEHPSLNLQGGTWSPGFFTGFSPHLRGQRDRKFGTVLTACVVGGPLDQPSHASFAESVDGRAIAIASSIVISTPRGAGTVVSYRPRLFGFLVVTVDVVVVVAIPSPSLTSSPLGV